MKLKEIQNNFPKATKVKVLFKMGFTVIFYGFSDDRKFALENEVEMIEIKDIPEIHVIGFPKWDDSISQIEENL